VSRSASLVIAFLMKDNNWRYKEAHDYVKSRRSVIYPNFGFRKHLIKYEYQLGLISEEEMNKQIEEIGPCNKIFYNIFG
jgi:protein-tyrosine phosphatase